MSGLTSSPALAATGPVGERRTLLVTGLTAAMMVLEIVAGHFLHSMALFADGWHMGTHVVALGISAFAYVYARRHAADVQFAFGPSKIGPLGGSTPARSSSLAWRFISLSRRSPACCTRCPSRLARRLPWPASG